MPDPSVKTLKQRLYQDAVKSYEASADDCDKGDCDAQEDAVKIVLRSGRDWLTVYMLAILWGTGFLLGYAVAKIPLVK